MFRISQDEFDPQSQLKVLLKNLFKVRDTDSSVPEIATSTIKAKSGGSLSYNDRMNLKK